MIGVFLIILILIIVLIVVGSIVLMSLVVFGTNKMGYKKTAKFLGISFLGIILLGGIVLTYEIFKDKKMSKSEINETLSKTKIFLSEDFEILDQKETMDFELYKNEFKLEISENDKNLITRSIKPVNEKFIIRDSTKTIIDSSNYYTSYDTLRVIIFKNNLFFYRANIGREGIVKTQ